MLLEMNSGAIARDTLDFINVPSETGAERDGSLFFAELLRREGFEPELDLVEDDRPNVYARLPGTDPSAPALLFNGHTDTIPIGQSAPPALDGDWVVGRGAEDMKGGLVAVVHAAIALKRAGIRLKGDLWLTGVIDHETPRGRKLGPRRLIDHLRSRRINANAIVIVEGPCAIWSASLGSTIFRVRIESSRGILHTIKVPYLENPACWLGRILTELESIERAYASAPPHPLCGPSRVNIGMITAGDYPNRLPTPIELAGTWRWMPGTTHAHVRATLEEICARLASESGLAITCSFEAQREPFETPADHPIVQALLPAPVIGMGLVGDANLYANEAKVPTVYYGPAHETAHSDDERVSVTQLVHCAQVYARAATRFCGVA